MGRPGRSDPTGDLPGWLTWLLVIVTIAVVVLATAGCAWGPDVVPDRLEHDRGGACNPEHPERDLARRRGWA